MFHFSATLNKKSEIEINQPSDDGGPSTKENMNDNNEEEKKLSSRNNSKKNNPNRLNTQDSEVKLERIKSESEPFKKIKTRVDKSGKKSLEEDISESTQDAPVECQPKCKEDEDKTDYGASKMIKGGIVTGTDGYYHANIISEKIEDPEGNEDKSRILKVKLMPIK